MIVDKDIHQHLRLSLSYLSNNIPAQKVDKAVINNNPRNFQSHQA